MDIFIPSSRSFTFIPAKRIVPKTSSFLLTLFLRTPVNMSVNTRVLRTGLLLALAVIVACAAADDVVNVKPVPQPRTFPFASRLGNNKENDHDLNSKLTVVKYTSSKRGTRFKRDTLIDTEQIEAPAPVDLEPSATFWPFNYLFGPDRRRVVVTRGGRPFGTYKRKEWWPSGGATRTRWW